MVVALSIITILTAPVLIFSTIVKVKAFFAGRKGAPLLQPYYEIIKLFNKNIIISETASYLFIIGSIITFISSLMVILFIPIVNRESFFSFTGDLIFLVYLMSAGRFFMILSALDTGSSFEGMGSVREATFSILAEPALFLSLMAVSSKANQISIEKSFGQLTPDVWQTVGIGLLLIAVALFIIILVENSRIPIDDPNTHLELTMIHEVMILDHSGPLLALMEIASLLKLFTFISLLVHLILPFDFNNLYLNFVIYYAGLISIAILIGIVESIMARIKLKKIPTFQIITIVLSGIGMFLSMG